MVLRRRAVGIGNAATSGSTAAADTAAATTQQTATTQRGAAYEAHVTKADGTHFIVTFDEDFGVVCTDADPGGPGGAPPAQQDPATP